MLGSYGVDHETELATFTEQMEQEFFATFKRCQLVVEAGDN